MAVSVLPVHLCGHMADWELWFGTAVQITKEHHYAILLAIEKMKIKNSKYSFYRICIWLSHHFKVKK